jgi:hypothetical protein
MNAVKSDAFKKVLASFKRLHDFVDAGSPGRNWNDATALVISGKRACRSWATGPRANSRRPTRRRQGLRLLPGFRSALAVSGAGDVFVFPKTDNANAIKAQNLLATVMTSPAAQVAFSAKKGSIPIRPDVDAAVSTSARRRALRS